MPISNVVSYRRLRWLGHLARMPDERLPKRMLFGHMDGSGVRGRSLKQWIDYVREGLQLISLVVTWCTLRKGSMSGTISDTSRHILTSEMSGAEGRLEVPEVSYLMMSDICWTLREVWDRPQRWISLEVRCPPRCVEETFGYSLDKDVGWMSNIQR